jgi:hypothetical protein
VNEKRPCRSRAWLPILEPGVQVLTPAESQPGECESEEQEGGGFG